MTDRPIMILDAGDDAALEILDGDGDGDGDGVAGLPAAPMRRARTLHRVPEETRHVVRPGLRALPSGTLVILGFTSPQLLSVVFLFWAIWWPAPTTPGTLHFAIAGTVVLVALSALVVWLLLRRNLALAAGILRAPFTRITVTDRRVVWNVPWSRRPLMEIDARRIVGGILGPVNRRGTGSAAMILREGDPSADFDGNIHFDHIPHAARFVAAIGALA